MLCGRKFEFEIFESAGSVPSNAIQTLSRKSDITETMLLEDYFYNNLQVTSTMEDASDSASRAATDERLLENAFQLKLLCPSWEARDVLHAVGIELDRDDYDGLRKKIRDRVRAHIQQHGMPVLGSDDKSRVERAVAMLLLMTYNPEADGVKPIKLTDTMKIAGFSPNDCSTGTAPYMRCYRLLKKKGRREKGGHNRMQWLRLHQFQLDLPLKRQLLIQQPVLDLLLQRQPIQQHVLGLPM